MNQNESRKFIYAEDVGHYWKTSQKSPDAWLSDAKKLIKAIEGIVTKELVGTIGDNSAIMLEFIHQGQIYRIIYNVLPSKTNQEKAAKIQAATMLFHEVKMLVVLAKAQGVRGAFARHLVLGSGVPIWQATNIDIEKSPLLDFRLPRGD